MADAAGISKVELRRLPVKDPPLTGGGRMRNQAGEMAQIVSGPAFRFLAYIDFAEAGVERGNHVHERRVETVYVIRGSLRAVFHDLDTGVTEQLALAAGDLVVVQPRCAHAYIADGFAQAVELAPEPYDPDDTARFDLRGYGA
jgi:mannose-6-phosphate isomerase-like protein (cupin superfamily)